MQTLTFEELIDELPRAAGRAVVPGLSDAGFARAFHPVTAGEPVPSPDPQGGRCDECPRPGYHHGSLCWAIGGAS